MAHMTTAAMLLAMTLCQITGEILLGNMTDLNETTTDTYINATNLTFFRTNEDETEAPIYKNNETLGIEVAQWGGWSSWFCSVPCGSTGFLVRTRNCNWQHESRGICVGKALEQTDVCNVSHIKCPFDCPNDSWGVGCDNRCSFNCLGRRCDSTTGVCNSCQDYYFGDYCEFRCFKGKYGKKCENSCGHLCFNGCNLETGSCAEDITIFVAVLATITIICFLPTIIAYVSYSRAFGLTSPLTTAATVGRRKS